MTAFATDTSPGDPKIQGLNAALDALNELLGPDHVLTGPAAIASYARSTLACPTTPSAVLRPASGDEVAGIARIAERHRVPLYPISRGRNWGYGDACAVTDGQVIVDLGRMNRIVEVDAELAYAVIEPGVTQGQLSRHLRERGLPLWLDCTGAGPEASIVGNVLERGFGHTPYGNRFENICGMQVVLAGGRIVETGFGHFDGAKTANVFPTGLGPALHGLFTQSNLGIVTRLGLWLMPAPERFEAFFCFVERHQDVASVVDALRPLRLDGTLRSIVHIGNDLRLISSNGPLPHAAAQGRTPLPPDVRAAIRRQSRLGAWLVAGGLFGTRHQVAASRRAVRAALAARGRRLVFIGERRLAAASRLAAWLGRTPWGAAMTGRLEAVRGVFDLNRGVPTGKYLAGAYWRRRRGLPPGYPDSADPAADNCGLYWLSPVIPMTGAAALDLHRIVEPIFDRYGFDLMVTLSTINERALGAVLTITYDREDPDECGRAQECYQTLFDAVMEAGYPPYRVGIQSMADIARGSTGYWETVASLKQALDPTGIIAPGRYDPLSAALRER